jgi:hypothetical protein
MMFTCVLCSDPSGGLDALLLVIMLLPVHGLRNAAGNDDDEPLLPAMLRYASSMRSKSMIAHPKH